ncbi:PLP-dependent aminotransferase family protein [Commensalibacter sp. W8133]|uniref:aminotransferase-like domain-containing protein n=1 Tax=Commensalibacter sp. W8133 TaxID=2750953 RepID=UPI0018DB5C9B|nr:PLP-dependent aminotransferase family protein [Commensalibacter sp. W8133]MBI0018778.1 PLP-dependent aminotransferase family protein [Commensalibacter sp. W8133]
MWTLSSSSNKPLYQQLIHLIQQAIINGTLGPGERLPSERQLSHLLNINRSTVIRALNELTDRKLLIRKIGSGSYVNPLKHEINLYPSMNWYPVKSIYTQYQRDPYQIHIQELRKKAQEKHINLIDMATGDLAPSLLPKIDPTDLPWQHVLSLEQDDETTLLGLYSFRQAVQYHMKKRIGISVDLSEILITTGTQQALFLLTQTLLGPGDHIAVETPSSFFRLPIFQASGLRVHPAALDQNGVNPEILQKLIRKYPVKMIFLNPVFQNPTGSILSSFRKKEILRLCHDNQIPLIEDDAYSLLSFDENTDCRSIKMYDKYKQVIYLGSLSKYIGKATRVGWIIAPRPIIHQLANVRRQIEGGISVLPQLLAQYYLTHQMDNHFNFLQKKLSKKAKNLCHWLDQNYQSLFQFQPPKGGLYLYSKCPPDKNKELSTLLQEWLKQKIIIAKGEEFGGSQGEIRFNFSHFSSKTIKKLKNSL